jgi:glucokinase
MVSDTGEVLAVDVGGTKLAVGRVDHGGRVVRKLHVPTPRNVDAEGLWRTLLSLVESVVDDRPVAAVGVGCGGPMRWPAGEVSPLNIPAWRRFPLRRRLQERFPDLPVRVHNDAVCLAVGEHWRGAGAGVGGFLGMVVSTGVGGGVVVDGRVVDGLTGNAGHVGHVVVDPHGPPCACGGSGCLEAIASGPAVAAWAQREGWHTAGEVSGRAVAEDAARGHPVAIAALTRSGQALGVAIASVVHLLEIEAVAVGGGLSQAGPLLFGPMQEAFRRHARMPFARDCRIVPAALGPDAGLVGAAALVLAGDRYWSGN